MKKAILGIVLCLVLATFSFSMGFSLKLTGGAAYVTSGDYNDGIDGLNAYYAATSGPVTGSFSKLRLGMNFGGEFILNINESFGIGLGVGYLQVSRDTETITGPGLFGTVNTWTLKPSVTSIPITLNVHYTLPMGGVNLNLFAGVGYYISKMKVDSSQSLWSGLLLTASNAFASNSIGGQFGFQGGLGLEIPLGGNFAFVVDVTGRYVSLSDIQGDYTTSGISIFTIPLPSVSGTDQFFYTYTGTHSGTSYKLITMATDASASGTPGAVHAKFDLSGVSAQAGFKIGF
jgi:hypothetical protein